MYKMWTTRGISAGWLLIIQVTQFQHTKSQLFPCCRNHHQKIVYSYYRVKSLATSSKKPNRYHESISRNFVNLIQILRLPTYHNLIKGKFIVFAKYLLCRKFFTPHRINSFFLLKNFDIHETKLN